MASASAAKSWVSALRAQWSGGSPRLCHLILLPVPTEPHYAHYDALQSTHGDGLTLVKWNIHELCEFLLIFQMGPAEMSKNCSAEKYEAASIPQV